MKHLSLILLMILPSCGSSSDQWPHYLGPNRDGTVAAPGLFNQNVELERLWIQPLGSGFSGIIIGDGKLYTMHTNGEMDALSKFDAATGKKLWSYDYGPSFPKVGSSEPGPLSTPVLDGNRIYGLGGHGELFCVNTSTGKPIWTRHIVKEFGAQLREVGAASSPLISGDLLVLNLGDRKDKSIAAFHKQTGKLVWHLGDEVISFQTPAQAILAGQDQIIALSESLMRGLDPDSGEVLWQHDSESWIQSFPIGADSFLTSHYHGVALYQVSRELIGFKVKQKWYTNDITTEYDMPVHFDGYIFGFKNYHLTCLDAATGQKVWASPENGMGILADGHIVFLSSDGKLIVVRAWGNGYDERASLQVFVKTGLTAPSYADGVFYVRNYTHIAAIKVK